KIAWVSWGKVCKSKCEGGLWVIDLRAVNLALLGKWRWRLISGGVGVSRDIILARYGSLFPSPHLGVRLGGLRRVSWWWRNASLLGGAPLRTQFQRLFQVSTQSANDSWLWNHDPSGYYSVKSTFLALSRSTSDDVIFSVEEERLLPKVWKTLDPLQKLRSFLGNFFRIGYRLVKISGSVASLGMLVLLRVCYVD
ncbi:ribonuclease H protein, partial [Trifolium medium]|nr:ribonuclease H protein [Trifolium medium]